MSQHISFESFDYMASPGDPSADFKRDVAFYSHFDPLPTIESMGRNFGIPSGAIAKYVLAKWATSGSDGLLEIGPNVMRQMATLVRQAEARTSEGQQLEIYRMLGKIVTSLHAGLPPEDRAPNVQPNQ